MNVKGQLYQHNYDHRPAASTVRSRDQAPRDVQDARIAAAEAKRAARAAKLQRARSRDFA